MTTKMLVSYDTPNVPAKGVLEWARLAVILLLTVFWVLIAWFCAWAILAIFLLLDAKSRNPFLTEPPLDLPPFWFLVMASIIGIVGMLIETRVDKLQDKYHKRVHQGEIIASELVQAEGKPLKRLITVRGNTLANDIATYTLKVKIGPNDDPNSYEVGEMFDDRPVEVVPAASLGA